MLIMIKKNLMKKIYILIFCLLPSSTTYAASFVKPILNGKIQNLLFVNSKVFGKPIKRIKGGEDECNGGFLPDKLIYKDFTLLDDGRVDEVIMSGSNGLIFHKQRIEKMSQQKLKQKFKSILLDIDDTNPNVLFANVETHGNDSIEFIFKSGQLYKYRINYDDC